MSEGLDIGKWPISDTGTKCDRQTIVNGNDNQAYFMQCGGTIRAQEQTIVSGNDNEASLLYVMQRNKSIPQPVHNGHWDRG